MDNKNNLMSKLMGIIFFGWFIGSMILMVYLSEINGYYTVMVFGQYFLVFGLIPLFNGKGKDRLISIPFILIGLAGIIIPYLMMNPSVLSISINWEIILPILCVLAFTLIGFGMLIIPRIVQKKMKQRCNLTICAQIVRYDCTRSDNGSKLYCPVYSFEFEKQRYEVSNNIFDNFSRKTEGSIVELKINPNNPNEFLDNRNSNKVLTIIGIIFIACSLSILILFFMAFF